MRKRLLEANNVAVLCSIERHKFLQVYFAQYWPWNWKGRAPRRPFIGWVSGPSCSQWPKLHIERRVNLWRNLAIAPLLDKESDHDQCHHDNRFLFLEELYNNNVNPNWSARKAANGVWLLPFTSSFARYITEASILHSQGMPTNSFSLVLDGDPAPNHSSQLFELVKANAAWQVAYGKVVTDHNRMMGVIYMSEVFPQAISNIIEVKSIHDQNAYPPHELSTATAIALL